MVQTFFERSFAINRLRQGPLAGHIDLLAARLATDGYSRVHSRIQLRLVGHFNRWLEHKDLTVEQIDEEIIGRYWRYFNAKKASALQRRLRVDEATRSSCVNKASRPGASSKRFRPRARHCSPVAMPLIPDPANQMHGRSGFFIHADSIADPGSASEGCIVPVHGVNGEVGVSFATRFQRIRM